MTVKLRGNIDPHRLRHVVRLTETKSATSSETTSAATSSETARQPWKVQWSCDKQCTYSVQFHMVCCHCTDSPFGDFRSSISRDPMSSNHGARPPTVRGPVLPLLAAATTRLHAPPLPQEASAPPAASWSRGPRPRGGRRRPSRCTGYSTFPHRGRILACQRLGPHRGRRLRTDCDV